MTTASIVKLPQFSVIKLSGADAVSFLQGQVTCDVPKLKEQPFLAGCHCNAKGKMWSTFIAVAHGDDILLISHKDSAKQSLAELNKYGVFAKVDITDDSENWFVYGADSVDGISSDFQLTLADDHFLILNSAELDASEDNLAWWQSEVLSGRAHLSEGMIGEYVPQMLNLQALEYISFNKGCYMGQEMVARTRYLGKNKRALYIAEIADNVSLKAGDDIARELNGNKRNIGKVVQSISDKDKTLLQLVLPNDTELTEILYTESNHEVTLLTLPYSLD